MGMAQLQSAIPIQGFAVSQTADLQQARVLALAQATADFIGLSKEIAKDEVKVNADYLGAGYSIPTPAMVEAVHLVARMEGILLDPVYTGKAMAGLIDWIGQDRYRSTDNVMFLHTGGQAGLFGFCDTLSARTSTAMPA